MLALGRTILPIRAIGTLAAIRPIIGQRLPLLGARTIVVFLPMVWVLLLPAALPESTLTLAVSAIHGKAVVTVTGCRPDFKLVQFIPLRIGTIPIRNGKQLANPATDINRLRIVHVPIMNQSGSCIQYSRKTESLIGGLNPIIPPFNSFLNLLIYAGLSHVV